MSVLAIKRGIECTSGLLKEINENNERRAIKISRKTMRTLNGTEGAKEEQKKVANIQEIEIAQMSEGFSKLSLSYNLKILNSMSVVMNDSKESVFVSNLEKLKINDNERLSSSQTVIAQAILNRIISGAATWRNRSLALSITTILKIKELDENSNIRVTKEIVFDHMELMGIKTFNGKNEVVKPIVNEDIFIELANKIKETLFKKGNTFIIEVEHILDLGCDKSEIFPSELFTDEEKKLGRSLYSINNTAAMTSQKIQNALRRYDRVNGRELACGEWGTDLSIMEAFRTEKFKKNTPIDKRSFYYYKELLKESTSIADFIDSVEESELVYFQGVLVKGGVFGDAK
jgi:hypothetical protein